MKLLPNKKVKKTSSNFFDLPSTQKKKIIKKAVEESTRGQIELMRKYGYVFGGK